MAENKKGFMLYADQKELFSQLSDEQAGQLIKHIYAYVNDENPETDSLIINLAFTPIKQQLKRDLKKYISKVEINRENGKKGGRPKSENNRSVNLETETNPSEPKKPDKDNDTDNDTDNVTVTDKLKNNIDSAKARKHKLTLEDRKLEFRDKLVEYVDKYGKDMIRAFFDYWTEHGDNDKKMKFEKQSTFGIPNRLASWKRNEGGYSRPMTSNVMYNGKPQLPTKGGLDT